MEQAKKSKKKILLIILGVLIVISWIFGIINKDEIDAKKAQEHKEELKRKDINDSLENAENLIEQKKSALEDAYFISWEFIKDKLKSPSTAEFPTYSEVNVQELDSNQYFVNAYVDSQNGFGAIIRTNYSCVLTKKGEKWLLDKLNMK